MYERNNRFGKMHYDIKPSLSHTVGDIGATEWEGGKNSGRIKVDGVNAP